MGCDGDMVSWRSDRGRIYVKYGPPDQVEEQPQTALQPAYLLWRYFQPSAVFVFADRDGFGRYVLVNATRGVKAITSPAAG